MTGPGIELASWVKFLALGVLILGVAAVDVFLERMDRAELAADARRYEQDGRRLLAAGKPWRALEPLRRAHTLQRNNREYLLTLAGALAAAGQNAEAKSLVDEALARSSNNGLANLLAARLLAASGDAEESESYYHRAIYGEWAGDEDQSRRAARLELADSLAREGKQRALLAELIPLWDDTTTTDPERRRTAELFLKAGSPARAAEAYQQLISKSKNDPGLYAGLGEAQLARGDYESALAAFLKAFHLKPDDSALRQRMELASAMTSLDPTPRQLWSREKYRRSLRILELVKKRQLECAGEDGIPVREASGQATNEMAEATLAEAASIWQETAARCGPGASAEEEPLRLIMLKLGQQ